MAAERGALKLSVLLVDDDRFHRERLRAELVALGHSVHSAHSAAGAIKAVLQIRPDYVAIEPLLSGICWVRFLRNVHEVAPEMPWLVTTAYPSVALLSESLALGAAGLLTKPVSAVDLVLVQSGCVEPRSVGDPTDWSLARIEWEHLNNVLWWCDGNMTKAARRLGIPRQSLYNKLKKQPAASSALLQAVKIFDETRAGQHR